MEKESRPLKLQIFMYNGESYDVSFQLEKRRLDVRRLQGRRIAFQISICSPCLLFPIPLAFSFCNVIVKRD